MAEASVSAKRCSHCKETKPASDFYRQGKSKDGLQSECKTCERDRRHSNHTRAMRNAAALRYQKTTNGKAIAKRTSRRDVAIGANAARQAVYIAIKKGLMPRAATRQCVGCQGQAQHYHHHLGYGREHHLDVLPVCAACHKAMDAQG